VTGESGAVGLDANTRLCVGCHVRFLQTEPPGAAYTLHPVGIPAPQRRSGRRGLPELPLEDVRGTPDADDDVIACTTCHFPHQGPNPYLLRWSEDEMIEACTTCHRVREDPPADRRAVARNHAG
jgi:predicted CXXCH cytochrome family protein